MPEDTPTAYIPLPAALHDPGRTAGRVFDRMADRYHASRPGYPPEAIAHVSSTCHLRADSRVLEVGCGTGQATRALAPLGCSIRGLEPGPNLAEVARTNLAAWPNVDIVVEAFESAEEAAHSYDAIVSATAFHWIDPRVSYAKAAELIRPGGHLALLTNAHAAGGTQEVIAGAVQALHRQLAPEVGSWTFSSVEALRERAAQGGDIAAVWARVDRKLDDPPPVDGIFSSPDVTTYPWIASYDRDGYLDMLRTQSSYALMPEGRREELMRAMGMLIDDELGGRVTKQYVCIVAIAETRPGGPPA